MLMASVFPPTSWTVHPWVNLIWQKTRAWWLKNPLYTWPYNSQTQTSDSDFLWFSWSNYINIAQVNTSWTMSLIFTIWTSRQVPFSWVLRWDSLVSKIHKYRWWISVESWGSWISNPTWYNTSPWTDTFSVDVNVEIWDIFKFEYWVLRRTNVSWFSQIRQSTWDSNGCAFYSLEWDTWAITIL